MNPTHLTAIISLLIALSVAAERLVEIVKGLWPFLNTPQADPTWEGRRRALLQLLAVAAGIGTAWLARGAIPNALVDVTSGWSVLALGLLASGGSGLWNAILTYFVKVKDIKAPGGGDEEGLSVWQTPRVSPLLADEAGAYAPVTYSSFSCT